MVKPMQTTTEDTNAQASTPTKPSYLQILDHTGHTEVGWDPDDPTEVEEAKKAFTEAKKKGYQAFRMQADGTQGEQLRDFDPYAGRVLMLPQLVGG